MIDYVKLMRPWQWYKNLVIFLPLIFTSNLTNIPLLAITSIGFLVMSLASSGNYIINDLFDRKSDRMHPEKKNRPIAAGKVSVIEGIFLASILILAGLTSAFIIGKSFFLVLICMIILTNLYSIILKDHAIIDIVSISALFALRAVAGAAILNVAVSSWLIIITMFVALFLAGSKRSSEMQLLGNKAYQHRKVYKKYTPEICNQITTISAVLLLTGYCMYSFYSAYHWLIYTLPFAMMTVLNFHLEVQRGSPMGASPEKGIKDIKMVILVGLWTASVFIVMYIL